MLWATHFSHIREVVLLLTRYNLTIMKLSPTTKHILLLAGVGVFLGAALVLPGLSRLIKPRDLDRLMDDFLVEDEWEKFDKARLRQKLKLLYRQKMVRIYQTGDKYVVQITKKGQRRLITYKLDELQIPKPEKWDGKWRIVVYDIPTEKNLARDALRATLKKLEFFELQKSVYLYPYPCSDAIDFIREIYGVGEHVTLLTVGYLEDEEVYKEYFSL